MPRLLPIYSQSDYLIQIVAINSHTYCQTVQIQISWLLQKPTDLDLHCLQRQGTSGFSRTRVNLNFVLFMHCHLLFPSSFVSLFPLFYSLFCPFFSFSLGMFLLWPSTKIVQAVMIWQKTWPLGGGAYFLGMTQNDSQGLMRHSPIYAKWTLLS